MLCRNRHAVVCYSVWQEEFWSVKTTGHSGHYVDCSYYIDCSEVSDKSVTASYIVTRILIST